MGNLCKFTFPLKQQINNVYYCLGLRNLCFFRDNDNVQKCLETFGQSGIVFIWKCYDPPDNLERAVGNRDIAAMLCWRLYCYRICKGYHSRDAAEKSGLLRMPSDL